MKRFWIDPAPFAEQTRQPLPVKSMELKFSAQDETGMVAVSVDFYIPPDPATPDGPDRKRTYLLSISAAAHLERLLRQALREALYGTSEPNEDQLF